MINSSEITVVIKGLIVGRESDNYFDKYTYRSIESVRKFLPDSKIILSTWEGSDVSGLNPDKIILNKDPGSFDMLDNDGNKKFVTVNNQIITSKKGLLEVKTKYSLIIRSDIALVGRGFLRYFEKYNKKTCNGYLDKKIVVLPTYSPRRVFKFLFNTCDWVYFGLTKDLNNIFSIPLINKEKLNGKKIEGFYQISENLGAEQYVWINFLKKYEKINLPNINYFSKELNYKSEESYAKNTIMISAKRFGISCLKMPNSGYGAIPFLSQGLYTFSEYKKIYNKYNDDKIFYIENYLEEILYFFQLKFRFFVKKVDPNMYKNIVNFIRKCLKSKNLIK